MDKRRWSLVGFVLALPIIAAFWWTRPQPALAEGEVILPDGAKVEVEIAGTSAERSAGLSGREHLPEGRGMLFLFDAPGNYPFWMRAMNFPIDIVWLLDDQVVFVVPNVSAAIEDQLNMTTSPEAANRVLELPAGYAGAHGVVAGVRLDIRLPSR